MAVITTAAPAVAKQTDTLVLADGVELIGEYEGSGFKEPPLLARRADGQVVQLSRLLYLIAASCDGRRDAEDVAAIVSERSGRALSAGNVRFLVEEQLRPQGVLALADGTTPELPKRRALLALRHRRPIASERVVNAAARTLVWLHRPPIQALVLLAVVLFDGWLLGVHGIAPALRSVLYEPELLLGVLAAIIVATVLHELGHASACRYAGARPGAMGIGVYLVWPAFYCDVTDAYRLDRRGRLRTDLGGVYFNGIFLLLAVGAYFATGEEALLLAAFLQNAIVLQQLLPLLRFDGYYVLSDLTGVPDILSRIKPIFRSLVPGRREPRVAELKPWVRLVVTAYLILLVPALALLVLWIVVAAPRMVATAYDSLALQLDRLRAGSGAAEIGAGAFRIAALLLPPAAIALSVGRSGRLAARGIVGWARGSVVRSAVAAAAVVSMASIVCSAWWPDRDYTPIRPGERGTIGEAVARLPEVAASASPVQLLEPETIAAERAVPQDDAREKPGSAAPKEEPASDQGGRTAPDDPASDDEGGAAPEGQAPLPDPAYETPTPAPTTAPAPAPAASPSPDPTATATPTPTPTATPTPTPTETAPSSVSETETAAPTPSPEPTP